MRPDRNPLRRLADRVEAAVIGGLIVAFAVCAPFAGMAAGHWAYRTAHRIQQVQDASWHRVPAVLLKGVPQGIQDPYGTSDLAQVPARWTAPDGSRRTGPVTAAGGAAAGTVVAVWTDSTGTPTGPPLKPGQVKDRAELAGVGAVFVLALMLIAGGMLARGSLNRVRLAAWGSEWDATGPHWTSQR
jgi:hypothetical protein